ncbi:hypothetical protein FJY90_05465 [Candidatus Gottesmanbacteria bacterium]|nr:hypothetical protein [Candidatus Gottesmanbacteria bacterium]
MSLIRKFQFNKNPTISGYYTIRASNRLSAIWEYLGRYKSISYSKKIIGNQVINNKNLVTIKSEQLSYTISQSEEYFASARKSNISIKPLLIYYGIVGLSKSLIISGDNKFLLNTTKLDTVEHGSHGLSCKAKMDQKSDIKTRDSLCLVKEFCRIKSKGLYPLFRSCYCIKPIPNDTRITILDIISLIGENWKKYYDFFQKPPNVYKCWEPKNGDVDKIGDNKQIIGGFDDYFHLFHRKNTKEKFADALIRLFPELKTGYLKSNNFGYKSINNISSLDSSIVFSDTPTLDSFALVQPFSNFKLTDFDIYFILFFILSNLCRYRQDKWYKLTHKSDKKDEFFLIENLFDIVQYKFPLLILRELEQKDYRFIGEVATLG